MGRNGKPRKTLRVYRGELDRLSDEELLELRFCDLRLSIDSKFLKPRIEKLHEELAERGLRFRPHCWLSEEWFSPDGVPGIAIPFYLASRRLMRLERRQMLEVEGGTVDWCMKILRHEAGHAIDTAYRLRRRRSYRETFGMVSQPYPNYYHPRPFSRDFVHHLDMWYAQAHPVEDFAETFAVWLKPRSRWRAHYKNWPAYDKLQYVDQLMSELKDRKPVVNSREHVDPLRSIRRTLRYHYQRKRKHYGIDSPDFFDGDLRKLFSSEPQQATNGSAAAFLNRIRPEVRRAIARWTGESQYTIDQVLTDMVQRCRELKLRMNGPEDEIKRDAIVLVTIQTMNYLHGGHHRVAL